MEFLLFKELNIKYIGKFYSYSCIIKISNRQREKINCLKILKYHI